MVADLAAHWTPHYTAVAFLFALWFAFARDIRWTIFALALTLYHGVHLIPLGDAPEPVVMGDELRIVSFNVKRDNANPRAVVDYLLATDADVIVLIEPTGAWRGELDRLQERYPSVARALRDDAFGLAFFSRLKDSRLSVIFPGVPTLPAIQIDGMTAQNKIPFTLYAVHAPPPLNQLLYTQRNAVFAALADLVSRAPAAVARAYDNQRRSERLTVERHVSAVAGEQRAARRRDRSWDRQYLAFGAMVKMARPAHRPRAGVVEYRC